MKIAYLAGPYRAATEWDVEQNIQRAEAAALQLWRQGYAVLCPHKNTAHFGGALPDQVWLNGSLEFMSRLRPDKGDIVVMLSGSEESDGTQNEKFHAHLHGLTVRSFAEIMQNGG